MSVGAKSRETIDSRIKVSPEVKMLIRSSILPLINNNTREGFEREFKEASGIEPSRSLISQFWDTQHLVDTLVRSQQDLSTLRQVFLRKKSIRSSSDPIRTYFVLASFAARYARINANGKEI